MPPSLPTLTVRFLPALTFSRTVSQQLFPQALYFLPIVVRPSRRYLASPALFSSLIAAVKIDPRVLLVG